MLIENPDQFEYARRHSKIVLVYFRETGELEGRGVLTDFDDETITILSYAVGVLHFVRENVDVYLEDSLFVQ